MPLFTKKIWKNRKSEYPTRRKLTKENGNTELVTVARSEGIVSQEGDAFSADNMNNLESRIQKAIGSGDLPAELGADIISAINSLNEAMDGLLNKNGDKVDGKLELAKGYNVWMGRGTLGIGGYVIFAELTVTDAYINHGIEIVLGGRGRGVTIIQLRFETYGAEDPEMETVTKFGDCTYAIYYRKISTSKWQLCAPKNEPYGAVEILALHGCIIDDGVNITYPGTQINTDDFIASEWIGIPVGGKIYESQVTAKMTAATSSAAGTSGAVPSPGAGTQNNYLTGAGTWQNVDNHTAEFTSNDVADGSANAWTTVTKLTSGETYKSILGKISTMFKNVRYVSARIGKQNLYINANSTTLVKLSPNNIYLISLKNKYNLGGLFLVQTGDEVDGCAITTIVNTGNDYFKLERVGIASFNVKAGNADGYLNALQLNS